MAVYTDVPDDALRLFLRGYDLGELLAFRGIAEGVENSNYALKTEGGDFFWARDDELDASLRYAVTPNLEVYADFANLLNGPGRRFAGVSARTVERETFGRRYTGGIRFNF